MSDERLFPLEDVPEVPIFREPRRVGARAANDQRFRNDYPPDWHKCTTCGGRGKVHDPGGFMGYVQDSPEFPPPLQDVTCPACLGMGSLKARVRFEAGHRCIRCGHPYIPKGDAKMLGVQPSGAGGAHMGGRWSPCDIRCDHPGPYRIYAEADWREGVLLAPQVIRMHLVIGTPVEAEWRILTVHHLDGDKANVRWWNLAALCQRCHLLIQHKVLMERVYPFEHSEWFKDYVAGYYAFVYLCSVCGRPQEDALHEKRSAVGRTAIPGPHSFTPGLELTREEVREQRDELLALELATA